MLCASPRSKKVGADIIDQMHKDFQLRLDASEILHWASEYSYQDDSKIENEIAPPEPCNGNGYAAEAKPLPRNLKDAVQLLDRSKRAREILGDAFVDHYVRTREWEVRQFERAVTNWELERYFELV